MTNETLSSAADAETDYVQLAIVTHEQVERSVRMIEALIKNAPPPAPGRDSSGFGDAVNMQVVRGTA